MTEMSFSVYTNRWGSNSTYRISKTVTGWHVAHIAINGDCDQDGQPFLYSNFEQDGVNFPSGLGGFIKHLWGLIERNEIDHAEAQLKLQQLADWVSNCERSEPTWSGWN